MSELRCHASSIRCDAPLVHSVCCRDRLCRTGRAVGRSPQGLQIRVWTPWRRLGSNGNRGEYRHRRRLDVGLCPVATCAFWRGGRPYVPPPPSPKDRSGVGHWTYERNKCSNINKLNFVRIFRFLQQEHRTRRRGAEII